MSNSETDNNSESRTHRRPLEKMSYADKGRFFKIRNILNLVFIILVIVGMIVYLYSSHNIGGAILIASIIIKFAESVLRIMH
jgi:hypothetical protein